MLKKENINIEIGKYTEDVMRTLAQEKNKWFKTHGKCLNPLVFLKMYRNNFKKN